MTAYIPRIIDQELDRLLPHLPALLLDGPKGVGKTTTGERRARTVRRLDEPGQRAVAEADPDAVLDGDEPILLDEWQRVPDIWDAVKRHVDADYRAGRFLLAGSAAARPDIDSGAGRITTLRMRPLTIAERGLEEPTVSLAELLAGGRAPVAGVSGLTLIDYTEEILRSGFPAIRQLASDARRAQLDSYIDLIVDRDLRLALDRPIRNPVAVGSWLTAYAAAVATTTSYEKIRDATTAGIADKPARTTVQPYIEALSMVRILDPVRAWTASGSRLKGLAAAPKHHLADPALAARLLGVGRDALIEGKSGAVDLQRKGPLLGGLFDSLATLSVRVYAQAAQARAYHFRTHQGRHEADIVVEREDGRILAMEVKLSGVIDDSDVAHLHWLREQVGDRMIDAVVLNTGPGAYRRADGVGVVPLALLGP